MEKTVITIDGIVLEGYVDKKNLKILSQTEDDDIIYTGNQYGFYATMLPAADGHIPDIEKIVKKIKPESYYFIPMIYVNSSGIQYLYDFFIKVRCFYGCKMSTVFTTSLVDVHMWGCLVPRDIDLSKYFCKTGYPFEFQYDATPETVKPEITKSFYNGVDKQGYADNINDIIKTLSAYYEPIPEEWKKEKFNLKV